MNTVSTTPAAPTTTDDIAAKLRDTEAQLAAAATRLAAVASELTFWRDTSVALALDVQEMRGQLEARGVTHQSRLFLVPAV